MGSHADDERFLTELARVFSDSDEAVLLATNAGFPQEQLPKFKSAISFWSHVIRDARNGTLARGAEPIIEQAAKRYPHNPIFSQGTRIEGPSVPHKGLCMPSEDHDEISLRRH